VSEPTLGVGSPPSSLLAQGPVLGPIPSPHPNRDHGITPWLDEQIWGHRLWDAQGPWLVFLEFLTVADARHRDSKLLEAGGSYPLIFRPQQRMHLRNILFNSDDVMRVAEEQPDSRTAWDIWLARMSDRAQAVPDRDFAYLRTRFHEFKDFAHVVRLLRGAVVERGRNKRWSSRFVFPFGANALYEDLNVNERTDRATREYINFGRTGELLYLMLCRSARRAELLPVVMEMISTSNRWDRLVALLQPNDPGDQATRGKSFLPYASHPAFDALAEDWLAVSRLRLPGFDAYPHYVSLAGLHLVRYHTEVAAAWATWDPDRSVGRIGSRAMSRVQMTCEIVAPKKTLVRELALASYALNDALSSRAIEQFIEQIRHSDEWQRAATGPGPFVHCRQHLKDVVSWGDDYDGPNDPEVLLSTLRSDALKGHRDHVGQFHRTFGREIGLVSRRGTTRFRYAPTDQLIRTLLFANVKRRMEFGEFLALLYDRYGLVIGEREAEQVLPSEEFDKKAFQANSRRLEQRLASMGLLRRLSDACAYVINPYGEMRVGGPTAVPGPVSSSGAE
jgi:hypothetical protein